MLKSILKLSTGTLIAQAAAVCTMPIISRMFSPEDFGIQATFVSYSAILATYMTLSLNQAISIERRSVRAKMLLFASLIHSLIATIVALFISFAIYFNAFLDRSDLNHYILFLTPIMALIISINQTFIGLNVRSQNFNTIAINSGLSASISALRIFIGLINPTALGLILSNIIGTIISIMPFIARNKSDFKYKFKSIRNIISAAISYKDFIIFRMPQNFLNMLSLSLPIIIMSNHFGKGATGELALAMSALGVPAAIFSQAISHSFTASISKLKHNGGDVRKYTIYLTIKIALFAFIPFLIVSLLSPYIFPIVFGDQWHNSGFMAQYLSISSFFMFLNKPAVIAMTVCRNQHLLLIYEIFSIISKIIIFFIAAHYSWMALDFILGVSITSAALYSALIYIGIATSERKEA